MKKVFLSVALLALFCTFFSAKIVGFGVKIALRLTHDCELAYRNCKWEERRLIFSDLVLFDPTFHTHIEQASLKLDWSSFPKKLKGHITVDGPHIILKKERALPSSSDSSWFDFSFSVNNGMFDWDGVVQFSLDHNCFYTQAALDWENANALITFQEGKWEASLNDFSLPLLNHWIPYGKLSNGSVTGRLAVDSDGNLFSANLKVINGAFDLGDAQIAEVNGALSYNTSLGTKWECSGVGLAKGAKLPFSSSGRRFVKNHWLESETRFEHSVCKISKNESWHFECDSICACEASWFQGIAVYFCPEIATWKMEKGIVSGEGVFREGDWKTHINARDVCIKKGDKTLNFTKAEGDLSFVGADFIIISDDYKVQFNGEWENWRADVEIGQARLALQGGMDQEKLPIRIEFGKWGDVQFTGEGWINQELNASFAIDGELLLFNRKIPFYCPLLSKFDKEWDFDFRLARQTWDYFRLSGTYDGDEITYHPTSQFLGQPLYFAKLPKGEIDLSLMLPQSSVKTASFLFKEWNINPQYIPQFDQVALQIQYNGKNVDLTAKSADFSFHVSQLEKDLQIELISNLVVSAVLKPDGNVKGYGKLQDKLESHFEGKIDPNFHCSFALSETRLNLQTIDWLKFSGEAVGAGHFIYNGEMEADFDFELSSFQIDSYPLENEGPIHLSYSSKGGALLKGLHLHGPFDCVVDLLEYNDQSHWVFNNAQFHIPGSFLKDLDEDKDLNFTANLDFASDFSTLNCFMQEASIPYKGSYYPIENLNLAWRSGKCQTNFYYLNHLFQLDLKIADQYEGRLSLGDGPQPLTLHWTYDNALSIHSIEGAFSGIDASFHAESANVLVGSAHLNFKELQAVLPTEVGRVFDEIKMGQGYELKGRLKFENKLPSFKGILTGKAIELFGFQFRTLLGQVDLKPDRLRIYDVKISDSSGMMSIDQILIEDNDPWIIEIPNLTIYEMRPSLLTRPGEKPGPISPLVVRELRISDFKGLLEDGKTYTGKGFLHFINSYKREETVFDLPANVLSRIVGLDLELLIPVMGDVTFDIKNGYFNLIELKNAYSEGKRSQFFLEMDPPPKMDLDGNLEIFIKMKQFVLLKLTESFLISIDGCLDDPQYSLKRKRFFGLM